MAEIISCPACQRKLELAEAHFGQRVQCPQCQTPFMADPLAANVQTAPPVAKMPIPTVQARSRESSYGWDDRDDFRDYDDPIVVRNDAVPHRGSTILTLGIIAIVFLVLFYGCATIVCGPLAWIMGNRD